MTLHAQEEKKNLQNNGWIVDWSPGTSLQKLPFYPSLGWHVGFFAITETCFLTALIGNNPISS